MVTSARIRGAFEGVARVSRQTTSFGPFVDPAARALVFRIIHSSSTRFHLGRPHGCVLMNPTRILLAYFKCPWLLALCSNRLASTIGNKPWLRGEAPPARNRTARKRGTFFSYSSRQFSKGGWRLVGQFMSAVFFNLVATEQWLLSLLCFR